MNEFGYTYKQAEALEPYINDDEEPIESAEDYYRRFKTAHPNFPYEVVIQWFYEHRHSLLRNSWLGYSSLKFELATIATKELSLDCLYNNPFVAQYRNHFKSKNTSQRMTRISKYIEKNGTWPVPPIILSNPDGAISFPRGTECDSPYHILEGHHRTAVLTSYFKREVMAETHNIWLAFKS
jgi:hypothetical protein